MLRIWHSDLVKHEYFKRLLPQDTKNYILTMVEAVILQAVVLWKLLEQSFSWMLWFARISKRHVN